MNAFAHFLVNGVILSLTLGVGGASQELAPTSFFSSRSLSQTNTQSSHNIAKRNVDLSSVDFFKTIVSLYGPDTFIDQIAVGASLSIFRTAGFLVAQWIYCGLLNQSSGQGKKALESLDYLFNTNAFVGSIGRNLRNYSLLLFGRTILLFIVVGPSKTIESLTAKSLPEVFQIAFKSDLSRLFYGRFVIEGIAAPAGWLVWYTIGNIGRSLNPRRKRRNALDQADEFLESQNVPKSVVKGMERVMLSLRDDSGEFL